MPRTYRGRDILWWLDAAGVLDQRYDEADDLVRARNVPSMQLVGSPGRTVDLNALSSAGVRLAGRLAGIAGGVAQFSGSLPNVCALADLKLGRLLNTIDAWAGGGRGAVRADDRALRAAGPGPAVRPDRHDRLGDRDTGPICPGSRSRCSTAGAGSSTTAA